MRDVILAQTGVSSAWKYGMPFFCYNGKMIAYLWIHRKHNLPYMGLVDGKRFDEPFLVQEKRSRMKIMLIDPAKDLPVRRINQLIRKAVKFSKDRR